MTTVFVDCDACPVTREAVSIARSHHAQVVLVGNESQNLAKWAGRAGVETVQAPLGRDAVDFVIVAKVRPDDVVVTGDTGLAAMALGRGAKAVGYRGKVYLAATIDAELAVRHAEQRHRRAGGRTRGPAPLEDEDRERFRVSLERLLAEVQPR